MRKAFTFLSVALAASSGLALAFGQHTAPRRAPWTPVNHAAFQHVESPPRPPQGSVSPAPAPEPIPPGPQSPQQALTLADLESMALANNPTLAQAAARVQAARGRWVQAGLYPNPRIGYMAEEIGNDGTAGMQGGGFSQEIVRGGKLGLDRAVASREIAQVQQQLDVQRWRVINDVRIQFYNLLVAQRAMELSNQLTDIGGQGLKSAEDLFRAEEVSRVDVLQAKIELSTAQTASETARHRHAAAWRRMAATIGIPEMQPVAVSGDLQPGMDRLTWEDRLQHILSSSPELGAAIANVERARWALARARAEPIPNVDLTAAVQHDNESGDDIAAVTIMVPIPIHNANQGAIVAAEAELRVAQADVARLQLALQNRLATAFERYAIADAQVDRYQREILPNARQSLDLVNQGYRQGEFSYVNVLMAQRTFAQTNLMYLNALQELWESRNAIDGLLLSDSLEAGAGERAPMR
jgi:cobalt-zinc-cadmium efflux system outer membrane protein